METSGTGQAPSGTSLIVGYELDQKDRIVGVSGDWDRFALSNGGEELIHQSVIGHPLRRDISGDITRMFLDTLLSKLRLTGRAFSIPYRCDSPGTKRYMEMHLSLDDHGHVNSSHRLVREEALLTHRQFLVAEGDLSVKAALVKRCSMCNRLCLGQGEYFEPDDFPGPAGPVRVIYHVCQDCQSRLRRNLAAP